MESLREWREFKARQKNMELRAETCAVSRKVYSYSFMDIPMPERAIVISRLRFENLRKLPMDTAAQREYFETERTMWFSHLKETMKNFRLSKEKLAEFGLNWNECKKIAYGA